MTRVRQMMGDIGSAVVGQSIERLRALPQSICPLQIIQENDAPLLGRGAGTIEINIFVLPVVSAQTHHISFVADDVNQFVIAKKSAH